jgi:glycosyltransferase involved in cell wall biosynthesis
MKIAVLSTAVLPSSSWKYFEGYGGLEPICGSLAQGFAQKGHEVTLVGCQGSQADGVKIIPVPIGTPEEAMLQVYRDILPEMDIVQDHSWAKFSVLLFAEAPDKYKKPKLQLFHHGVLDSRTPPPIPKPCWTGFSRKHAQYMSSQLGIPVKFAWHGIDPYPLCTEKDDYYLILNRLSLEKGVHEALQMLKKARKRVIIAGETRLIADQNYAKRIADECDNLMVRMIANPSQQQKIELLQKARAMVHTPLYPWVEAFGLTISEAMSCGTPVLALDNGGVSDQVVHGETGFMADDIETLSTYIDRVGEIKPEACRQRVLDNFTTEKMVGRHLKLIDEVLAGGW